MALMNIPGQSALIALGLAFLAGGCGSGGPGKLTLDAQESHQLYAQDFAEAYITSSRDGEYDIVLLQESIDRSKPFSTGGKPLQPVGHTDLRQLVHIHIFWQATGGSVAKDGVVTNATISWYLIGREGGDRPEVLRYEGAGYVMLDEGKKTTRVQIRDGQMRRTQMQGGMRDPLGPSRLTGGVVAKRDGQVVREILADLKYQMDPTTAKIE